MEMRLHMDLAFMRAQLCMQIEYKFSMNAEQEGM